MKHRKSYETHAGETVAYDQIDLQLIYPGDDAPADSLPVIAEVTAEMLDAKHPAEPKGALCETHVLDQDLFDACAEGDIVYLMVIDGPGGHDFSFTATPELLLADLDAELSCWDEDMVKDLSVHIDALIAAFEADPKGPHRTNTDYAGYSLENVPDWISMDSTTILLGRAIISKAAPMADPVQTEVETFTFSLDLPETDEDEEDAAA